MTRRSPGEGWRIRRHGAGYRTGYTDPSGKRRHIYARTAKEAKAKRDAAIRDSQLGVIAPPHRTTTGSYLVAWVNDVAAHRLAPRTVERYRGIVDRHIVPAIGKVPLSKLTGQHIARLYADLAGGTDGIDSRASRGEVPGDASRSRDRAVRNGPGAVDHVTVDGRKRPRVGHRVPAVGVSDPLRRGDAGRGDSAGGTARKSLSPASIRYVHAVLRSALAQAVTWRLLPVNPAEGVKPPRKPRNEIQPLNAAEARALIETAADDPLLGLYVTALHTGMRLGELLGLTWDAIDWSRGTIEVRGTLHRVKAGEYALTPPKTPGSRRTVPMNGTLAEALRQHRSRELERLMALGYGRDDMRWVFTDRWGEPIYWGHVTERMLRPLCRKAGIREIRFHDTRHTAATLMLQSGVPPHIVAQILGHSNPAVTMSTYAHVMPGDDSMAMKTLERALVG